MNAFCSHVCAAACGFPSAAGAAAAAAGGVAEHATAVLPVPSLLPLDFTFVLYDPSSHLSLLLAFVTFAPILLIWGVGVGLLLRRDIEAAFQLTGLLLSTAVNMVLKRWVAEHRPLGSAKLGHGMPSDHTQCMTFVFVYSTIWLWHRVRLHRGLKGAIVVALAALGMIVAYSRVHLGVHSIRQVVAGAMVGGLLGASWGMLGLKVAWDRWFPALESSWIGRKLALKDAGAIVPKHCKLAGAAQFEYELYQLWKKQRRREEELKQQQQRLGEDGSSSTDGNSQKTNGGTTAAAQKPTTSAAPVAGPARSRSKKTS
jgi:dolichyldiphosphatase